ncbi:hypothetical protein BGZ95_011665 [Linnemannia exigua]|uniref:Uncharacterized protein n=1 Tax=Linnemannia exigua TaxID=604196 RepID=A0AAD4DJQ0_9FUNG|nr:hypothetical protein BGZ95_011665 [Linnemannia exigua]
MGKKGSNKQSYNSPTATMYDNIANSNSSNSNGANIARSKKVKLLVKNPFADMVVDSGSSPSSLPNEKQHPTTAIAAKSALTAVEFVTAQQHRPALYNPFSDSLFGIAVDDGDDGGDEYGEEDEESVVRARREALATLDPYNANAHKEHFKSLKVPKQQKQQRPEQEDDAVGNEAVLTLLPLSPPRKKSEMASNDLEDPGAVSTPPTSRTRHQKRDSFRSSLYSTPKTQMLT